MQRLTAAGAAWVQTTQARWIPLPLLAPAREELRAHKPYVLRLAHALGGTAVWFRHHAWPLLLRWEALVAGLPAPKQCTNVPTARATSALALVLGAAAVAAESGRAAPDARLRMAHRAALGQAWNCAVDVALRDGRGAAWRPQAQDCRSWRTSAPPVQRCRLQVPAPQDGALQAALADLHRRGIWRDDAPCGRWLASPQGWTVLWPLAGRDLLRAGGLECSLTGVLDLLLAAGYRPAARHVHSAVRADGRTLEVLPVTARLRRACGLPPGLPQRTQVRLIAPAPPLGDCAGASS